MREKHYLKKVDFIKEVANSAGFLRGNSKAKTAFLLSQNNFRFPHTDVNIQREIDKMLEDETNRLSKQYDFTLS